MGAGNIMGNSSDNIPALLGVKVIAEKVILDRGECYEETRTG